MASNFEGKRAPHSTQPQWVKEILFSSGAEFLLQGSLCDKASGIAPLTPGRHKDDAVWQSTKRAPAGRSALR